MFWSLDLGTLLSIISEGKQSKCESRESTAVTEMEQVRSNHFMNDFKCLSPSLTKNTENSHL